MGLTRTFGLRAPVLLSWRQLYRQFGVDPSRASDKVTVQAFRREVLRELFKIKLAWPDLGYRTVRGGLVVSPSPPADSGHAPTPRRVACTTPYPGPEQGCAGRSSAGAPPFP